MALIITNSDNYDAIAEAIRAKTSSSTTYKPSEMATAIMSISGGGGSANIQPLSVSVNGTYTASGAIDGYSPITVSVPIGTDVTDTTATASDVKNGKIFHLSSGTSTTGTLNYDWMGENPELIAQVYNLSTTLSGTDYPTVFATPSTTAKTIKATETISTTYTLDMEHYDYILYWISDCQVAYDSTWTATKATCLRETCFYSQAVIQRPASIATAEAGTFNYNASQENQLHIYWCKYYSTASAISLAYTTYSPCYISAITAATLGSTSSLTPKLTIKTPVLSARCSSTYFSTAMAAKIDQANTTVKMKGYLYRVKRGTTGAHQSWQILDNIWQNPL